jgi:hypothetical protein
VTIRNVEIATSHIERRVCYRSAETFVSAVSASPSHGPRDRSSRRCSGFGLNELLPGDGTASMARALVHAGHGWPKAPRELTAARSRLCVRTKIEAPEGTFGQTWGASAAEEAHRAPVIGFDFGCDCRSYGGFRRPGEDKSVFHDGNQRHESPNIVSPRRRLEQTRLVALRQCRNDLASCARRPARPSASKRRSTRRRRHPRVV